MPANPKYLNPSASQKFAKISAGLLGGYLVSALFHMALICYVPWIKEVLISSIITIFMVWGALMIIPFLFTNGWKAWGLYLGLMLLFGLLFYFGFQNNPLQS